MLYLFYTMDHDFLYLNEPWFLQKLFIIYPSAPTRFLSGFRDSAAQAVQFSEVPDLDILMESFGKSYLGSSFDKYMLQTVFFKESL